MIRLFWIFSDAACSFLFENRSAEMAISTNPKPTIYRNLYENAGPGVKVWHAMWFDPMSVFCQRISQQTVIEATVQTNVKVG